MEKHKHNWVAQLSSSNYKKPTYACETCYASKSGKSQPMAKHSALSKRVGVPKKDVK